MFELYITCLCIYVVVCMLGWLYDCMLLCTSVCIRVWVCVCSCVCVCVHMRVVASSAGSVLVYLRCCLCGILPVGVSVVLFGWLV